MLLAAPLSKAGQYDTHTFQAEDHNVIKDWWLDQGGSIDTYLYSENSTTGSDGTLGNEYICLRDDVNKVYVGRSDICVDRAKDDSYSYIHIDKIDWTTQEYIVGQTGDLIGDTSQYWSGCYTLNGGWGGYSAPGGCPALNDTYGGQINFAYVQKTLTNIAAINIALEQAGIEATGYNYSWSVKNWDANRKDSGNGRSVPDTFYVDVVITDSSGNSVFSKRYDYSYYISDWTEMAGQENFANPFDVNSLSEIQLSVTGKDIGFWAGYYGPEFRYPSIKLNYRYAGNPLEEESLEDQILLSAQCSADPLFSPECPGYNDAMLAQIAPPQDLYSDSSMTGIPDSTGTSNITGGITNDTMDSQTTGMVGMETPDPTTGTTVQETQTPSASVAQATGDADPSSEAAASDPTSSSSGSGRSLNANELNALSAAENVASAATSIAAESSSQSLTSSLSAMESSMSSSGGGFGSSSSQSGSMGGMGSMDGSGGSMGGMGNDNNMDLAMGGSVETQDITGEEALAQSEQLSAGANMADIELASLNLDLIKDIVLEVTNKTLQENMEAQEEAMEEANEQSIAEANAQEDALAQAAMEGSTDEDAMAALLGYNPNFRAYQQPQMADGAIYVPRDIYGDKKNYDNPNARFFNGASDAKHRAMVRSQYEQ